ncbi:YgaP family membrane protein [Myroides indicus]|uniref:Inner membrane protein YgaP-like transmembrane domain-containing protein n=1 Tax=Myroides indicus TaxID=1323422 RepID=A0A4R7F654_9FLAO|nr:DUF2892 domain-containing protein [Myroides indicus]TDS66203.1 hypothetical protein C8P70_10199 [Myroides indicus]
MTRERYIKLIAGTLILISSLGAYFVNINWIWLGVFVGANLFQFSLTNWCLLNSILKALGVKSELDCTNRKC